MAWPLQIFWRTASCAALAALVTASYVVWPSAGARTLTAIAFGAAVLVAVWAAAVPMKRALGIDDASRSTEVPPGYRLRRAYRMVGGLVIGACAGCVTTMAWSGLDARPLQPWEPGLSVPEDVVSPIVEELVFRGILWELLRPIGFWYCLTVTLALFTLMHVPFRMFMIGMGNLFWVDMAAIVVTGLACGLLREVLGVPAAVGFHSARNAMISLGY